MTAWAYYSENDPFAAQWLRNLIDAGHIAPGYVDERSISDVRPADLVGFTQCHFFAGIGVWSYALRLAGWSDDRPVWTGSCPCQPFSGAGKGERFADERHLWPHWNWLIRERRPAEIFGEQVASKNADPWIDLVQTDLEALDYAFGCVPFPAAGVGAPHIRVRNYWVADHTSSGRIRRWSSEAGNKSCSVERSKRFCDVGGMDHHHHEGSQRHAGHGDNSIGRSNALGSVASSSLSGGLADNDSGRCGRVTHGEGCVDYGNTIERNQSNCRAQYGGTTHQHGEPGPTNGIWGDADWLFCRDGKWRSVEPGTFPLAHGAPSRMGRLRAYGNAIVAQQAAEFIRAYLETRTTNLRPVMEYDL